MAGVNKALFLDRDGVINIDKDYVSRTEDFEFVDGIFELCKEAKQRGYLIVIVTNQSGIGRGYYTEEDFQTLMRWVGDEFRKNNAEIDKVYFCPFHAEHGIGKYRKDSEDRKPKPGMILKALNDLDIDPSLSLMIGDKEKDIEAARRAHLGKVVLFTDAKEVDSKADIVVRSLSEILKLL